MNLRKTCQGLFYSLMLAGAFVSVGAYAQPIETKEVMFSSSEARWLKAKAQELETTVAIYEYVRNSVEFQLYWGSRSGSVNVFSAMRGNDVDTASTLIAMLRSQGVSARYAVATIRLPSAELGNWLGVGNTQVAMRYLENTGIPKVALHPSMANTVLLEHVWVEVLVPFNQYRGLALDDGSINCQVTPGQCQWVSIDPSFKQKRYLGKGLDPYTAVQWDDADYTKYYDAMKDSDPYRKDRSVIHILEQDVLAWLRSNTAYNGYTLDDVDDRGEIISIQHGLLPASLPYQVDSNLRRYNTVAEHDAAEPSSPWDLKLKIAVYPCHPKSYVGSTVSFQPSVYSVSLSEISTDRFVLSDSAGPNNTVNINLKRGRGINTTTANTWNFGTVSCPRWQGGTDAVPFAKGTSFWIELDTDKEPGYPMAAPESYFPATVGGRFLIAAGGETSNWGQVHRAADALLKASRQYSIVYNASKSLPNQICKVADGSGCIPYVDAGPVGWDVGDSELADISKNPAAVQDLQGGLLEVAAAQYFAETREQYKRADGLLHMVTPLRRFVGVVRSDYNVQYLKDSTAFSIQPNGLVIDMAFAVGEPVRRESTLLATDLNHHFFLTFLASSLEHEVWQKLTGFDAMSTVRSIQVARNANQALKTYVRTKTVNDATLLISDMGFTSSSGECIVAGKCRASAANNDVTKYESGMVYQLYQDLKNFTPLLDGNDQATLNIKPGGWQTVKGPASMKIQMTAQPASGAGYKSQVFVESQNFGKLNTGQVGANVTFAISVTGQ